MAIFQGNQGQTGKLVGSGVTASFGEFGEALVSELAPRYYEWTYRGQVWLAANSAVQALSLNSATATGIILSNPAGSGKNCVILDAGVSLASLPAGQSSIIWTANVNPVAAATTHTTPLTVRNALLGFSGSAVGLVDSSATLPAAPSIVRVMGGGPAATIASSTSFPPFIRDEVAGELIVAPGCAISIQCLTTAITVLASIAWLELPI
jgi:hypothetical protein